MRALKQNWDWIACSRRQSRVTSKSKILQGRSSTSYWLAYDASINFVEHEKEFLPNGGMELGDVNDGGIVSALPC